ncbi:MAG: ABC transporter ATP-binding protein [Cyanophyceae cyanobacterium]
MDNTVIQINNVSKEFQRYDNPSERLRELMFPGRFPSRKFQALKDINLSISSGETLGIVGRNGSGKSTLLQIIVGTLQASKGNVELKGRISALLELGSGFNPEFTGEQNIFFNAQMLGLSKKEVEGKYDRIVKFADIGDFLGHPVKTYSSGMFVRLAFAVAVHTDPDILIVDDALSVGDEAFQRKCFARIKAIRDQGGTILFVSHGAATIVELCDRAILLDQGELLLEGRPKLVVDKYQKLLYAPPEKGDVVKEQIRRLNVSLAKAPPSGKKEKKKTIKKLAQTNGSAGKLKLPFSQFPLPRGEYLNGSNGASEVNGRGDPLKATFDPDLKPKTTEHYESYGAKIIDPTITTLRGKQVNCLIGREEYLYRYTVKFDKDVKQARFGMLIKTVRGLGLGGASLVAKRYSVDFIKAGSLAKVEFRFKCLLNTGTYFMNAGASGTIDDHFSFLDRQVDAAMFRVEQQEDVFWGSETIDFLVDPDLTVYEDASMEKFGV